MMRSLRKKASRTILFCFRTLAVILLDTPLLRDCESGINVKVIQDVLGHADISTTMDIYVDVMDELKKRERSLPLTATWRSQGRPY